MPEKRTPKPLRGSRHNLSRDEWRAAPRAYVKRGLDLPQTKLTPMEVSTIRAAALHRDRLRRQITEELSNQALADKFGVSVRAIERVLAYETHAAVP